MRKLGVIAGLPLCRLHVICPFQFTDIESGTTKDYAYGHLNVRYTFSIELRDTGKYGFLLPSRLIAPTAREVFEGIKAMIVNINLGEK